MAVRVVFFAASRSFPTSAALAMSATFTGAPDALAVPAAAVPLDALPPAAPAPGMVIFAGFGAAGALSLVAFPLRPPPEDPLPPFHFWFFTLFSVYPAAIYSASFCSGGMSRLLLNQPQDHGKTKGPDTCSTQISDPSDHIIILFNSCAPLKRKRGFCCLLCVE